MSRLPVRSPRRGRALVAVGAVAFGALALAACKSPVLQAACNQTLTAATTGSIANPAVDEASGIAASHLADDVYWVENDSGNAPSVYAVGIDGRDLGEWQLQGAMNVDWEDIAVGPGPAPGVSYLYLADIGGNISPRTSVVIYRVPEPLVDTAAAAGQVHPLGGVEALTLNYPDGPHDSEGFMVDPVTGQLYVVSKAASNAQVFAAPASLLAGSTTTLTQVATVTFGYLPGYVTAADVSPSGDTVALRTYTNVLLYQRLPNTPLESAFSQPVCLGSAPGLGTAPDQELQGEAIGFTRSGNGYVTVAEGSHPYLHRFTAP
jgi:hypothetical protein